MQQLNLSEDNLEKLFGTRDENLRYLEERLGVKVSARGPQVQVSGEAKNEKIVTRVLEAFDSLLNSGATVTSEEYRTAVRVLDEDMSVDLFDFFLDSSIPASVRRFVVPRNLNQRLLIRAVLSHDCSFVTGPAGTGKTYLAVAAAVDAFLQKRGILPDESADRD